MYLAIWFNDCINENHLASNILCLVPHVDISYYRFAIRIIASQLIPQSLQQCLQTINGLIYGLKHANDYDDLTGQI